MSYPIRTRFTQDIIAEVKPPQGSSRGRVILLDGMPSVPNKGKQLRYWSRRGYWAVHPRYRGTWESGGSFLDHSPHEDVLDVVTGLDQPKVNTFTNKKFTIDPGPVFVIGSSFGGTAALLASVDDRVKKVVAVAPVVDWTVESPKEPADEFLRFVRRGFGDGYRFAGEDWLRLHRGEVFQPAGHTDEFDARKIYILHALDDEVVLPGSVKDFAEQVGCKTQFFKRGGHLSSSITIQWPLSWRIRRFIS